MAWLWIDARTASQDEVIRSKMSVGLGIRIKECERARRTVSEKAGTGKQEEEGRSESSYREGL
jgi:hypothetical protein